MEDPVDIVAWAVERGLLEDGGEGLDPAHPVTRQELIDILCRLEDAEAQE